jgi:hypothetical protein
MNNSKNEVALNLTLLGLVVLSYFLFNAPNLVLYCIIIFVFMFLVLLYINFQNNSSPIQTEIISKKISDRLTKPIIAGSIISLMFKVIANLANLFLLQFVSLLSFILILLVLNFFCSIIDANLVWSFLKRNSPQ